MADFGTDVYYDSNYNFYVNDSLFWLKIDNNNLKYCEDDYNIYHNPNYSVYINTSNIDYDLAQEIDDTDLPELTLLTCGSEIYNQIKEGIYYFSNESQSGGGYIYE
jgi:hypothetical protein